MNSSSLYNLCTAGYVMSLAVFAAHVVNSRRLILRIGILLVAFSFLVQTLGMVFRWIEAGYLEVAATEKAIGQSLFGWSWFVVFTQHPPWSNLYEIMVYMSWGIVFTTLLAELRWSLAFVRQIGIILALMALGMAALTDATIKPLVPALKSWWIMIHVISASIAYAAGALAAFICLFALLKDQQRVREDSLVGAALIFLAILLFCLGGGYHLITDDGYFVKLLAYAGEHIISVQNISQEQATSFMVSMPYAGWLMKIAIGIHIFLGISLLLGRRFFIIKKKYVRFSMTMCFFTVLITLFCLLFHDFNHTKILVADSQAHHLAPAGPYFISFKSHTWSLGLFIIVFLLELLFLAYLLWPQGLVSRLPAVSSLETAAYKSISLSFFLMTVVLITGALWAHYAWGRYWAWDPKETGALAIWVNYAIYLHSRRTAGLAGPFSSFIGVIGFFVIIVGFLGVNLGLFADGLHTYGNS